VEGDVCWCVEFREGVRWKEMFVGVWGSERAFGGRRCLLLCGVQRGRSVEGDVSVLHWH
jgi:hypothetical protein